jgi:hypothetical protein
MFLHEGRQSAPKLNETRRGPPEVGGAEATDNVESRFVRFVHVAKAPSAVAYRLNEETAQRQQGAETFKRTVDTFSSSTRK